MFAAGSFSKLLDQLASRTRNLFHLIDFELDSATSLCGSIRTWEFNYGLGWNPSSFASSEFPHLARFGSVPPIDLLSTITSISNTHDDDFLSLDFLKTRIPSIVHLLPDELKSLEDDLKQSGKLRLFWGSDGTLVGIGKTTSTRLP